MLRLKGDGGMIKMRDKVMMMMLVMLLSSSWTIRPASANQTQVV